ncbi:hypothetical protein EGR_05125 [Echinococcus granulosus]|uniref:Uncharacterized protein n=1 Tax=Echinococcus granulosus TaxID=6210 RepID=W6V268_ECHGR|nr:hypothetical protein EGR_05125 [Echinococcus granulosus]EUB59964.1 hypothetical protein EGR_05125 [Echinococcus granulosus]
MDCGCIKVVLYKDGAAFIILAGRELTSPRSVANLKRLLLIIWNSFSYKLLEILFIAISLKCSLTDQHNCAGFNEADTEHILNNISDTYPPHSLLDHSTLKPFQINID